MLSRRIDRVINSLKWPVAILAVAMTPLLLWSMIRLMGDILKSPWNLIWFSVGAFAFITIWRGWLAQSRVGNWLIQFEHELTHLLFAVMTLHPILGFRASGSKGSHVRFLGKGNWLITASPYFFPTAAVLLWVLSWLMPIRLVPLPWTSLLIGFAVGYHLVSTYRETHADQTDLQQLTPKFYWSFLPAANLLVLGLLIAYSHNTSAGVREFVARLYEPIAVLRSKIPYPSQEANDGKKVDDTKIQPEIAESDRGPTI